MERVKHNHKKKKIAIIIVLFTILVGAFLSTTVLSYAAPTVSPSVGPSGIGIDIDVDGRNTEGDQYIPFYKRNAEILNNNEIISSAGHSIGWFAIDILKMAADASQTLFDKAFGFIDITDNAKVNRFVKSFKIVFIALTALSLLYLGFILIIKHDKKPEIATNIIFAILCVTCSTWLFGTLNDLAHSFKDGIEIGNTTNSSYATELVDNNVYDVLKLYRSNGIDLRPSDYRTGCGLTDSNMDYFDPNDVINYDELDDVDIFKYRLNGDDGEGNVITDEVYDGWAITSNNFGNNFYYRYNIKFLNIMIMLIALLIVYLSLSYKCVRIAFELVTARLLAYLYAAELSGGEKVRKILCFIRDSYILLAVCLICLRLFVIFSNYISNTFDGIVGGIFSLFLAFAVIDGPNLVEKLLGMDAGLSSSWGKIWASYKVGQATAKAAVGLGKGAKNFALAAATGKGHEERAKDHGHKTLGERAGAGINNLFKGNKGKNEEGNGKGGSTNTDTGGGDTSAGGGYDTSSGTGGVNINTSDGGTSGTSTTGGGGSGQQSSEQSFSNASKQMQNNKTSAEEKMGKRGQNPELRNKFNGGPAKDFNRSKKTSMPQRNTKSGSRYFDKNNNGKGGDK